MGVVLTEGEWMSPYGFRFSKPYVCVCKNINSTNIRIFESEWSDKVAIQALVLYYCDEESRKLGALPIQKETVMTFVPYAELGNPYKHIYEELKKRHPSCVDVM